MKFCKVCDNMYYIKVSDDGDTLNLYCRNCGDIESEVTDMCIHSSEYTIEETHINRFTKLDPTLPRIYKMPCQNNDCPTNTSSESVEIILIRYDNSNLKYLYLCSVCDHTWKTDIKN